MAADKDKPASTVQSAPRKNESQVAEAISGISRREYFALQILCAQISGGVLIEMRQAIDRSLAFADALIHRLETEDA